MSVATGEPDRDQRTRLGVFSEQFIDIRRAIAREKQLKGWSRAKKIVLIEKGNPGGLERTVENEEQDAPQRRGGSFDSGNLPSG